MTQVDNRYSLRIVICCSIAAAEEALAAEKTLRAAGHEVVMPRGITDEYLRGRTTVSAEEKAADKIEHDLIRGYFAEIDAADAVLIVNPERRGISGYIGGNTLIEMAFAHVLEKPLFCLYPLPSMPYSAELEALRPQVLNGDLSLSFGNPAMGWCNIRNATRSPHRSAACQVAQRQRGPRGE
jgi:hypothetical protein